jgi:hypothetical protein
MSFFIVKNMMNRDRDPHDPFRDQSNEDVESPRRSGGDAKQAQRIITVAIGFLIGVVIVLTIQSVLSASSRIPKDQQHVILAWDDIPLIVVSKASLDQNPSKLIESKEAGAIPEDVCVVDGKPLILNVNDGYREPLSISYVRNNGDLVYRKYGYGLSSQEFTETYWTGGVCPSQGE